MEPKKNPKYDVHRQRGVIFNLSLAASFVIVIIAFEWAVPLPKKEDPPKSSVKLAEADMILIPRTTHNQKEEPKAPKKVKPKPVVALSFVEQKIEKELRSFNPPVDQSNPITENFQESVIIEIPPDTTTYLISVVEKHPEPVGGMEGFRNLLQKNLKYPQPAIRHHTHGTVYVSFVVSQSGELSEIAVVKGIGHGCDEEAVRVIKLSRWNPGKQRGKPVKVRMVQPITFSLN